MKTMELIPLQSSPAAAVLPTINSVSAYIENARARNTIRGYRSDWI